MPKLKISISVFIQLSAQHRLEEIKSAMEGLLEPKIEEKVIGNLDVRDAIHVSKVGTVAGCFVRDGRILNKSKVYAIR